MAKANPNSRLIVKVPLSTERGVDELAKWLNSLNGATDESLDFFSKNELKLIILCARDREQSVKCQSSDGINELRANVLELTSCMAQLNKRVEESTTTLAENSSYLKSYAGAASEGGITCDQVRTLLKEEEDSRKTTALKESEKKSREKNIIVYGLAESLELSECSNEFLAIAEEFGEKPNVVDICRLGKTRDDNKPRPVRIKLNSKTMRQKIVANAHKLKNHLRYKMVYVKPYLTREERILQSELWTILKRKVSEDLTSLLASQLLLMTPSCSAIRIWV